MRMSAYSILAMLSTIAYALADEGRSGTGDVPDVMTDEEGDRIVVTAADRANIDTIIDDLKKMDITWSREHVLSLAHLGVVDGSFSTISEALTNGAEFFNGVVGELGVDAYIGEREDQLFDPEKVDVIECVDTDDFFDFDSFFDTGEDDCDD